MSNKGILQLDATMPGRVGSKYSNKNKPQVDSLKLQLGNNNHNKKNLIKNKLVHSPFSYPKPVSKMSPAFGRRSSCGRGADLACKKDIFLKDFNVFFCSFYCFQISMLISPPNMTGLRIHDHKHMSWTRINSDGSSVSNTNGDWKIKVLRRHVLPFAGAGR